METQAVTQIRPAGKLQYFPVSLFASVMGMAGLAIACERYEEVFKLNSGAGLGVLILAYFIFIAVTVTYVLKMVKHFAAVVSEFKHPLKANFFPAFSICLLLLSTATIKYQLDLAFGLWLAGAVLHFILTIIMVSRWLNQQYQITQINPAWFIPVVGNLIVPLAGLKFVNKEICWFFFSVGIFFWIILFALVFYRLVFHEPGPKQVLPTLFIFIAPPAVAFMAYTKLAGQVDAFARILLYMAWFFVILLLAMIKSFLKLDFFVTWWAYTFPLCAVTIASITAFALLKLPLFAWIAKALLLMTTLVVVIVLFKTLCAFYKNRICVPEPGQP